MKKVVLGEVCDFFNGGAWSDKEYVNEGIPVLKVTNCKSTGFQLDNLNYLSEKSREKYKKNNLIIGDIIVATVGSHPNLIESAAGRSCIVNSQVEGFYLNQNAVCIRTKDKRILSQKYLGYLCKCADFQHYIQSRGRGAANQMRISISSIKEYSFTLPDFENQQYIADILSAYDDLIENNQKQIKLLEEAAQRLYKEWFVDLRFPGHENTKIVDGVPEAWQWCKVRDVADINSSALPKNYKEDFIDYVDLGSVRCGHIETRTRYNLNEAPGRAKRCAKDGDIIWGMVRPNLKAYALVTNPKETDVFSTGFAVLSAKKVPYSYLYCAVTQEEFVGYLVNATNGAAYPAVKPVHFEVADILKPDDKVLEQFHSVTDSIYRKKEALENQNHNLRESRDLILPKLMSGEVEV